MGKVFTLLFAVMLMLMTLITGCGPLPNTEPTVGAVTSVPTGLTITQATSSSVTLTWIPSSGEVFSYTIYRNGARIGTTSNSGDTILAATTFIDSDLNPVTTYYYSVSSSTVLGQESAQTTPVTATTLAAGAVASGPPTATVSQTTTTSVTIFWIPSGGAQGPVTYRVYRNGVYVGSTSATSYIDSNLTPGTTYSYTISVSTESAQSTQVVATTQQGTAQPPAVKVVATVAGTASVRGGSTDAVASAASFALPYGIVSDGTSLFVADSNNNTIRRMDIATGAVTTLAGLAGTAGSSDGTGAAARFYTPRGIATDGSNLYVADSNNNTIRKIVIATADVSTLAGSPGVRGATNAAGAAASFHTPRGLATDGRNLYVADSNNHLIRKIVLATTSVSTVAGNPGVHGRTDGVGAAANFYLPYGITMYGTRLFVADTVNNTIRSIDLTSGTVSTLAGTAGKNGSYDGIGTGAALFYPDGMATDGTSLYVADTGNHTIRKIDIESAEVTTLAGVVGAHGTTDAAARLSKFFAPHGVALNGTDLYLADTNNHTIRKISLDLL